MKIHNLLCCANIVLEANDDLFPGLSSSVFDKKPKDKEQEDMKSLEAQQEKLQEFMSVYRYHYDRMTDYLERNDAFIQVPWNTSPGPTEVSYDTFDWFDKYSNVTSGLGNFAISKTSPLFKDFESYIHQLDKHQGRIRFFLSKLQKVRDKIENLTKKENKSRRTAATTSFGPYARATPKISTPKQIPKQIPIKNRKRINNPYVTANAAKQYAGHAAHYPHWSPYWKDQITQVEEILKRNNKGGLDMMYASTHQNGGARFNFVITGANGNLTWRKYDPSPGAGANWMYLDGTKINTSSLLSAPPAKQDKMVQSL